MTGATLKTSHNGDKINEEAVTIRGAQTRSVGYNDILQNYTAFKKNLVPQFILI